MTAQRGAAGHGTTRVRPVPSVDGEVVKMNQNLDSEKTPARASQNPTGSNAVGAEDDEQKRLDEVAMKAARRAENRFREDEGNVPGSTEFTK